MQLRVGVTGHRLLEDETSVRRAVDRAIEEILAPYRAAPGATNGQPVELIVVSALAEGADRVVAGQCLRHPGAVLEALLPLTVVEYQEDFATVRSREEFAALLRGAVSVEVVGGAGSREEAYERAGRAMVDRCDALIAVWDGRPARGRGGTADVVAYAETRGVPVRRIGVRRPRSPQR